MLHEELIEKYIQNRLTAEEELIFNKLLEDDATFKKDVALHTKLKNVIENDDDENYRALISNLEGRFNETGKKSSFTKWLVAASIILLLGFSYFFTSNYNTTVSSNELFASYFVPYRNVIAPIERSDSNGVTQQNEKTQAFIAYEKGEYKKAILLFTKLYTATKEPYYLFYKANALLKLERANEAVPLLLEHLKTKDTLTDKTNWYLALAYLKIENKAKAKELLNTVITNGSYKSKEAKKLLEELE